MRKRPRKAPKGETAAGKRPVPSGQDLGLGPGQAQPGLLGHGGADGCPSAPQWRALAARLAPAWQSKLASPAFARLCRKLPPSPGPGDVTRSRRGAVYRNKKARSGLQLKALSDSEMGTPVAQSDGMLSQRRVYQYYTRRAARQGNEQL
jgi:hypothetical protein